MNRAAVPKTVPEKQRVKRSLPLSKKMFFAVLATVGFYLALEGTLALLGFPSASVERDPFVGFEASQPLFVEQPVKDGSLLGTANNKLDFFNRQAFEKTKPGRTFRVFCLGGSTTYGRPYDDRTSFAAWLRELLPHADDRFDWEVINAGGISYASYRVANVLDELCRYEPDLFVIYTGHNEFLEERTYGDVKAESQAIRNLKALLFRTRTFSLLDHWLSQDSVDRQKDLLPLEVDTILDHSVGPDAYRRNPELRTKILEHFEFNLTRMIRAARQVGAGVILVKPASNIKDFSPFKSESLSVLPEQQWEEWKRLFADAQKLWQTGQIEAALECIEAAERIERGRAELSYLKGQLQFSQGNYQEAYDSFRQALQQDVCPLRALPAIQQMVEKVAISQRVPVIDFPAILQAQSQREYGHPIPGNEYFLDHVHPTIEGHRLLGLAILQAMELQGVLAPKQDWREQGVSEASKAIESRVDWQLQAKALRNLAQVLNWAGKQEEAGPLAVAAVELQQKHGLEPDPAAMFFAAVHYSQLGDTQNAISLLRAVLEVMPDFWEARYRLATLLFDASQYAEAERQAELCVEQSPGATRCQELLQLIRRSR